HAPGQRILDRDHGEVGLARRDGREGILEGRAGRRLVIRIGLVAGDMGIGPKLALKCDFSRCAHAGSDRRSSLPKSTSERECPLPKLVLASQHPLTRASEAKGTRKFMILVPLSI